MRRGKGPGVLEAMVMLFTFEYLPVCMLVPIKRQSSTKLVNVSFTRLYANFNKLRT
jgi:hypothetical protein